MVQPFHSYVLLNDDVHCTINFYPPILGTSFFFITPATPEIYTLSLHDALPISRRHGRLRRLVPVQSHCCQLPAEDRKSTRLNSSHQIISYAVFCLKKKKE